MNRLPGFTAQVVLETESRADSTFRNDGSRYYAEVSHQYGAGDNAVAPQGIVAVLCAYYTGHPLCALLNDPTPHLIP